MFLPRNGGERRLALIGMAGALLPLLPAAAQAQFSVSPVVVQIPASDERAVPLTVRNEGEDQIQFRAYALDFDITPAGEQTFWDLGTRAESCGGRLHVTPDAFSVPAGGSAEVAIRLDSGTPGRTCWSAVLVETSTSSQGSIVVNQRIGVHVYGLSAHGDLSGEVIPGAVDGDRDSVHVAFTVKNVGDWPLRPRGVLEIRDARGTVVAERRLEAFSVLPDRERSLSVALLGADLSPGRYLALPILDWGADFLAGTQIDFRIED